MEKWRKERGDCEKDKIGAVTASVGHGRPAPRRRCYSGASCGSRLLACLLAHSCLFTFLGAEKNVMWNRSSFSPKSSSVPSRTSPVTI